jgi:hypothetical protein
LKYWTKEYPNDKRPAEAIQAAEDYLNGKITIAQLNEKEDAAWDAARAAAWAAWAAWDAARDAAWAARDAEQKWQNKILKQLIKEAIL